MYLAMRELIEELHLDFTGIKGQPELTTHFATADVAEALLNDPYDWNGPKPPHVCATEADMDGALTMQLLQADRRDSRSLRRRAALPQRPRDLGSLQLGSARHLARRAVRDPEENLRHVELFPAQFYFPAGGASVYHVAAPGEFTFARLTRNDGRYRMHVLAGAAERYDDAENEALAEQTTRTWPHMFARLDPTPDEFLDAYASNHIHGVPGDRRAELRSVCALLDID